MNQIQPLKPITATFVQLRDALHPLHLGDAADISRLHDIWKMGAPTPNSRILTTYDPRLVQPGNYEARMIFPHTLIKWIMDVSARRGFPIDAEQAADIIHGKENYGMRRNR